MSRTAASALATRRGRASSPGLCAGGGGGMKVPGRRTDGNRGESAGAACPGGRTQKRARWPEDLNVEGGGAKAPTRLPVVFCEPVQIPCGQWRSCSTHAESTVWICTCSRATSLGGQFWPDLVSWWWPVLLRAWLSLLFVVEVGGFA